MEISQHIAKLLCPLDDILLWLRAGFLQHVSKGASFYIVHDDQERVIPVDDIDDAGQIRMIQPLQHIRLNDQSLTHNFKILGTIFTDFLDGPRLICCFIYGKVYNAHATLPDLIQDFIFSVYYRTYFKHCVLL